MASLSAVRTALAGVIDDISGLHVYKRWPNTIVTPALLIRRVRSEPYATFSGNSMLHFDLICVEQLTDLERARDSLDTYTDLSGTNSITAKLEPSPTLGSVVEYMLIGDWQEDETIIIGNSEYVAAHLPLAIHILR